ncbi:MAG: DUF4173 domain-containing protein [Lachnospiraceae bacterium]|nr:DUF4173 domain-containing protein [Lachnospiraceae bacterium]
MDNNMIAQEPLSQQVLIPVQPINNLAAQEEKMNKMKKKQKRFQTFGVGSFLYALFYTFCLYHNASGITYPFFAGGTLLFFGFFTRKLESSSADARKENVKEHFHKNFLIISIVFAGALNCTTDSAILIFFNKMLMSVLLGILLLQYWHDLTGWSIAAYFKGGMTMCFGSIYSMFSSVGDMMAAWRLGHMDKEQESGRANRRRILMSVAIGFSIAVPVAAFIMILLASADAVFFKLICDVLTFSLDASVYESTGTIIKLACSIALSGAVCYGFFAYNMEPQTTKNRNDMAVRDKANLDTYIAVTVNAIMCVIYLLFSSIQIFGLFLGKMSLPEGYTYASYARSGFFELVFVSLFNILLVLLTLAYFKNSAMLKILLTIICGCTYVMILSSAYRMILYISSYQLTFLRLFVLWVLVMTALIMTGVLIYIHDMDFSLFRYGIIIVTVGWLTFSAAHPDYWIASYNIQTSEEGQAYDSYYLRRQLSLDAAAALPEDIYNDRSSIYYKRVEKYQKQTDGLLGFRKFNFSRAYAAHRIDI